MRVLYAYYVRSARWRWRNQNPWRNPTSSPRHEVVLVLRKYHVSRRDVVCNLTATARQPISWSTRSRRHQPISWSTRLDPSADPRRQPISWSTRLDPSADQLHSILPSLSDPAGNQLITIYHSNFIRCSLHGKNIDETPIKYIWLRGDKLLI